MQPKRITSAGSVSRTCEQCGGAFSAFPSVVRRGQARFCGTACYGKSLLHVEGENARSRHIASSRAKARAFVDEVNAKTVCAHCGAQPIEWHNPEHVTLNRWHYRIGFMASQGRAIASIQAEMDRCTPLCRRCHMAEDGRLHKRRTPVSRPDNGPMVEWDA